MADDNKIFTPSYSMSDGLLSRLKEAGRPRERGQGFDAVASLGQDAMDLALQETDTSSLAELKDNIDFEKRLKEEGVSGEEIAARAGSGEDAMDMLSKYGKDAQEKAKGMPDPGAATTAAKTNTSAFPMRSPLKQERQGNINNLIKKTFGRGFKASAKRGSIFGKKTFADFQPSIKQKQEEFLKAQKSGESTLNTFADLSEISGSLQSLKRVMEEAGKVHRGVGWDNHLLEDKPELQYMLDEVMDGNDASVDVDENNTVGFNITMPDGSPRRVTEDDLNNILLNHIKPTVKANEAAKEFAELDQLGYNGRLPFDYDAQFKVNRSKINKDNLGSYLKNPIFGASSFIQDAEEDPKFRELNTTANDVYNNILKSGDPALVEEAIDEVANHQTRKMQAKYDGGKARKQKDEAELRKSKGESTSDMSVADKIEYYRNLA